MLAELLGGELHLQPRPAMRHAAPASALGEELGPPFSAASARRARGGLRIVFFFVQGLDCAMTTANRLNLWMFATQAERDAFLPANGLVVGDFCLVDSTKNLYFCRSSTAIASAWQPIAGVPTFGHYGLGGLNQGSVNRLVFQLSGVTFRAVLDVAPSSVTITPAANLNWPGTPGVTAWSTTGFRFGSGSSGDRG